jgi:hypothetical protein
LRGMGERWLGERASSGGGGGEGVRKGGVFEGLRMNEEGRRALGRGEANSLPSTVSWNCMSSLSTPQHVFISFPRHGVRHWCPGTGPDHMSRSVFGLHRLRGPPHVVIRSTCHFPVPRLAVCPLVWARLAYFILPPRTATRVPPSLTLSAFLQ